MWLFSSTPAELLVFPETAALAEILTDLNWRRHVAMLEHADDFWMDRFYRAVTRRLNQPSSFAQMVSNRFTNDPLRGWVHAQRHAHQKIRTEFWHEFHDSRLTEKPFPEIHHVT